MGLFFIIVYISRWLRTMCHINQLHQLLHFWSGRWFIFSAHAIDVSVSLSVSPASSEKAMNIFISLPQAAIQLENTAQLFLYWACCFSNLRGHILNYCFDRTIFCWFLSIHHLLCPRHYNWSRVFECWKCIWNTFAWSKSSILQNCQITFGSERVK